jgi:hypothetical protein
MIDDRGLKIEDRVIARLTILDPRSSTLDPQSSILNPQSSIFFPGNT